MQINKFDYTPPRVAKPGTWVTVLGDSVAGQEWGAEGPRAHQPATPVQAPRIIISATVATRVSYTHCIGLDFLNRLHF